MLTVVKIGGAWLEGGAQGEAFRALARLPGDLVLVHGGGKEISRWLDRVGVPVEWADGLRVTRGDGLTLTAMVLTGWVNKRVVEATSRGGRPAVGLSGEDAGLLQADHLNLDRYGEVGRIARVNPAPVHALLRAGFTPVISPISRGPDGAPLNVNADEAAIRVAAGLGADRLLLISDVPGVLVDGGVLSAIGESAARELSEKGVLQGGMRVKVEQALEAAKAGVEVRIGDEGLLTGAPGTVVGDSKGAVAGTVSDPAATAAAPSPTAASLLGTYKLPDFYMVGGEGSYLVDEGGKRYLDFTSGIAVNALGYDHPAIRAAVNQALDTGLIHVSNLFRTHPVEDLAIRLTAVTGLDRAFFCNSGAEAVEGALKFAKKWAKSVGGAEKHRIVAFEGGFHGRLHGSLAVTARPDYRSPFEPLMPGVDFVDPRDTAALDAALSPEKTAALILEPIQGEGGVRVLDPELLRLARRLTEERGIALIFDEIQCGLGRTGRLFAFEASGVRPDLLCLAKPLAGGLPMGAVLLRESIGSVVLPGDHGTTFGGGPLVSTVALAILDVISAPGFLADVARKGELLASLLEEVKAAHPQKVREIRGAGLIRGVELAEPAAATVAKAREMGLLTVPAGTHVIRLLPPYVVSDEEIRKAVEILGAALNA